MPTSQIIVATRIAIAAFVLSLGPAPKAWGHQFLPTGPYLWLVRIVPGFDGLRAPARISVVMYLALAALAAIGAARLFSLLSPRARVVAWSRWKAQR